ncbi:MAG: hypothetical protein FJ098_11605, partial [Deltaproteobacteria bacterium]|nr:hypothetical protein [Deltaproteobacteria bacterium]
AVDEDFKNAQGKYAAFEHCGTCTISCEGGFPNATAKCDASKATPACVVEECDDGYYLLNEFQCIPDTAGLCETCSTDENCVLQGAKCVDLGNGEKFCSKHCTGAGDCPAGYTCQSYAGDTQCIPDTGSCSCDGSNLQLSRSCSLTWPPAPGPGEPFTTCYGTEHCTLTGWGGCQLPSEVCDNLDNNCDGAVDEGFVNGDGKYYTTQHCGQCNNNCTFLSFPHASSVCNASQAVPVCAMSCQGNWFDVNGNPVDGCECQYTSATDVPDGTDQNCDGVDGEVGNAIFVAKNGSDASAGTMAAPMLTIQAAIQRAVSTGKRDVYVATGVYTQAITLAAGVQVYGGFSSDFKQRNKLLYETVIMGTAFSPSTPAAVNAFNLTGAPGTTALDGFTVYGKSNYSSGGTSYAVYLRNCGNAVRFTGNTVVSGNGGAGAQGTSGADRVPAASGGPGVNAYTAAWNNCTENKIKDGGEGGENTCGTTVVGGGDGGDAWCPNPPNIWVNPIQQNPPDAGENGVDGSGGETAEGGDAGWDGQLWNSCMTCSVQSNHPQEGLNGEAGEDGDLGDPGPGCTQETGQVTGGLWSSLGGQAGTAGAHGGGGGGGGAGRSAAADAPCTEQIGGTGGGGGAGGCAGTGGTGGTGGGGSFGLFLYFPSVPASIPTVSGNLFEGGVGGTGGLGGTGGTGGTGGAGGTGGTDSNLFCALGGGTGGDGGNGGHGGGGGGGCGGVSYCIFSSGQGAVSLAGYKAPANTFITGAHGSGGDGGPSVGDAGLDGDDGASAATSF